MFSELKIGKGMVTKVKIKTDGAGESHIVHGGILPSRKWNIIPQSFGKGRTKWLPSRYYDKGHLVSDQILAITRLFIKPRNPVFPQLHETKQLWRPWHKIQKQKWNTQPQQQQKNLTFIYREGPSVERTPQIFTFPNTIAFPWWFVPLQNGMNSGVNCQRRWLFQCLMAQGEVSSIVGMVSNTKICLVGSLLISKFRYSVSLLWRIYFHSICKHWCRIQDFSPGTD